MASFVINTREDLDAISGTQVHRSFMEALKGSMSKRVNTQTYPDGYGQAGYEGPVIDPIWQDVEDLSTIERFGFSKSDFE